MSVEPGTVRDRRPFSRPVAGPSVPRPAAWAVVLAFALVYVSWGTTYYAIRVGVHYEQLPPALFGGVRVCLAGLVVLAYLRLRGHAVRLAWGEFLWIAVGGLILFVGGNGLINVAMESVPSGMAAVLIATTPLWMALMETLVPRGDRLPASGWLGLLVGLGGVVLLFAGEFAEGSAALPNGYGPLLVLGSTLSWSLGSLVLRYRKRSSSHLTSAAYQMVLGGAGLSLVGLATGEAGRLPAQLTAGAISAFCYLLIVGSLVGFVAFNWLLGHVAAARVGTYAYVNPLIAMVVAWVMHDGLITGWVLAGMVVILTGVALVRQSGRRKRRPQKSGGAFKPASGADLQLSLAADLESTSDLARP